MLLGLMLDPTHNRKKKNIRLGWKRNRDSSLGRARNNRVADDRKRWSIVVLILLCLATNGWADESGAGPRVEFNIPQQRADLAVTEFAEQADLTLIVPHDLVQDREANELIGTYTLQEGIDLLLAGTGLSPTFSNHIVLSISADEKSANEGETMDTKKKAGFLAVIAGLFAGGANAQYANDESGTDSEAVPFEIEEIIVTGTRIVGMNDQFSPVSTFSRDEIDAAGFASAADLVASLPSNFGGGVSLDTQPAGSSFGAGAQAVNLRGLGAESTLTLLNGRRLAPGGLQGSFVDISTIPLSAIERVEVLTDGASAIYGADAIAGVVNVILREDYNGAETRLRFGTPTEGGGDQVLVGQTFGKTWDRGRALFSYEYGKDDEIDSNDKDFSSGNPVPDELLPLIKRQTVFGSFGFNLTDDWDVSLDAYYNDRETDNVTSQLFFGAPAPTTIVQDVEIEQIGATLGVGYDINSDWRTEFSASVADSESIATTNSPFSDLTDSSDTRIASYEATVGGPVFSSGDRSTRVLFGAQQRAEEYSGLTVFAPDFSVFDITNKRDVTSVFGEVYVPFVDESNARPGIQKFALNAAIRYEDYDDVGSSTNPKIGLVYAPTKSLTLRATFGESFRAPLLAQLIDQISFTFIGDYVDPALPGGQAVGLFVAGSTSQLKPETATSWTAGFDYEPAFLPGLRVRGTYFEIDYEDRVAQAFPSFDPVNGVYFDLGIPLGLNPDPAELAAFVAASPANFNDTLNSTLADVTIFGDLRQLNTSSTLVEGIDLNATYDLQTAVGDWLLSLDLSYLLTFDEQLSVLTPTRDILDTITNPADLRLRGGLSWSGRGRWSVSSFVNYVDSYKDDQVLGDPVPVSSWLTFDLGARLGLGDSRQSGFLSGMSLQLNARNIFDRDPPTTQRTPGSLRFGYDTANADPRGRTLSLQLTKSW